MVDTVATPMAYPGGPVSPLLIQSQQADPRMALARSLMEGAQQPGPPLLSPWQALAKGLQQGIAGYTGVALGQEQADRQTALGDTMGSAIEAGKTGGFDALASVLSSSNDPAAKQMALQYAIQNMSTKQAMQAKLAEVLMGKDQTMVADPTSPTGYRVIATPGAPEAIGATKQAEAAGTTTGTNLANALPGAGGQAAVITATTPAKAAAAGAEAGAKSAAELPYAGPKAGAEAAAKAPYEVVPVHGVGAFPKMTILGTGPAAPPAPAQSTPPAILSQQGYDALQKGAPYRDPKGNFRVKQ